MFPLIIDDSPEKQSSTLPTNIKNKIISPHSNDDNSLLLESQQRTRRRDFTIEYKSQAVKEIEEIARKRDERRQKNAEERLFREQNNLDRHNPHFDFAKMIHAYRIKMEFKPLKCTDNVIENQITVCVRKRPLNKKEIKNGEIDVISVTTKDNLIIHEPKTKFDLTKYLDNQNYRFDYVFNEICSNETVYKFTTQPLVKTVFNGGMATCFAYGQTGSGKTHLMVGEFKGKHQNFKSGIYGLAAQDIFDNLVKHPELLVSVSFFEIYGNFAFDLLEKKKRLRVLEDAAQIVQVVGLTEKHAKKINDIFDYIKDGSIQRTSGQTSANSNSSRSHAVFQIILRNHYTGDVHGKLSLIDLAGNERGADTKTSTKKVRLEGAHINKSLLTLKECIRALGKKSQHCPFRGSLLTKILRDSFIGDKSRTCMIALISPNINSTEHTLNTLRYADRVKELMISDSPGRMQDSESDGDCDASGKNGNNNSTTDEDDEVDLARIEDEVLQSVSQVIQASQDFQYISKNLLEITKKSGYNKEEFASKWKNLLKQVIDVKRDAFLKVNKFQQALQE